MNTLLIIASNQKSLVHFRLNLIKNLAQQYKVIACAPEKDEHYIKKLEEVGAEYRQLLHLERVKISISNDFKFLLELIKVVKATKPTVIIPYTIKPVVYAGVASYFTKKSKIVSLITGLGYFYGSIKKKKIKDSFIQIVTKILYKISLHKSHAVFFQNTDDKAIFVGDNIVKEKKVYLIPGSGIDLSKYKYTKPPEDKLSFLMMSRLIKSKGVRIYLEAAKIIKSKYPDIEFVLLGIFDRTSPDSISEDYLEERIKDNTVVFYENIDEVTPFIDACTTFVLPTYYREGVPRSILESLSVGRSVITTNTPGCRDTVNKHNGFLIKPNSVQSLVEGFNFMIKNQKMILQMSLESRKLAEEKFADYLVIDKIRSVL